MIEIFPDGSIMYLGRNGLMFMHRSGKIVELESIKEMNNISLDCNLYNNKYYIVIKLGDDIKIHVLNDNLKDKMYKLDGKDVIDIFVHNNLLLLIYKCFIKLISIDEIREKDRYEFNENFYDKVYDSCNVAHGYVAIKFSSRVYKCLDCKNSFTEFKTIIRTKYDKSEIVRVCPNCKSGNYFKKSKDEILILKIGYCKNCETYRLSEDNLCRRCNSELVFENNFENKSIYYNEIINIFKLLNINKEDIYKFLSRYVDESSVEKIMNLPLDTSLEIVKYFFKEEKDFKKKFNVLIKIISNCDKIIYKGINIKDYLLEILIR